MIHFVTKYDILPLKPQNSISQNCSLFVVPQLFHWLMESPVTGERVVRLLLLLNESFHEKASLSLAVEVEFHCYNQGKRNFHVRNWQTITR